jgi:hypothetical protein
METHQATSAPDSTARSGTSFRKLIGDAIRNWEPRRVGYNLVLAAFVLGNEVHSQCHFLLRVGVTAERSATA